jgi:hypothetical protein
MVAPEVEPALVDGRVLALDAEGDGEGGSQEPADPICQLNVAVIQIWGLSRRRLNDLAQEREVKVGVDHHSTDEHGVLDQVRDAIHGVAPHLG